MLASKHRKLSIVLSSLLILSLAITAYFYLSSSINIKFIALKTGFDHPADIIEFNGKTIVTELLSSKLAITDSDLSEPATYLRHPDKKRQFSSPHHLATNEATLFFSGGWGQLIYTYDKHFKSFQELPKDKSLLSAPHGICTQDQWLYIADSLHSRLIRVNTNNPDEIEVFADHDKRIAYGRQVLCHEHSIWISNSYEKREGLNPGKGSNIIKITDFESGNSDTVINFPNTNITGLYLHKNRYLFTAQWHANRISIYDLKRQKFLEKNVTLPTPYAGPPYGMYFSESQQKLYIAFIGDIYGKKNKGGIAVYEID